MAPTGYSNNNLTRNNGFGRLGGSFQSNRGSLTKLSSGGLSRGSVGISSGLLGVTARSVPKPVNTSSLRKENGGQDISTVLVNRQGGKVGWGSSLPEKADGGSIPTTDSKQLDPTPVEASKALESKPPAVDPPKKETYNNSSSVLNGSSQTLSSTSPLPRSKNTPWAHHPPNQSRENILSLHETVNKTNDRSRNYGRDDPTFVQDEAGARDIDVLERFDDRPEMGGSYRDGYGRDYNARADRFQTFGSDRSREHRVYPENAPSQRPTSSYSNHEDENYRGSHWNSRSAHQYDRYFEGRRNNHYDWNYSDNERFNDRRRTNFYERDYQGSSYRDQTRNEYRNDYRSDYDRNQFRRDFGSRVSGSDNFGAMERDNYGRKFVGPNEGGKFERFDNESYDTRRFDRFRRSHDGPSHWNNARRDYASVDDYSNSNQRFKQSDSSSEVQARPYETGSNRFREPLRFDRDGYHNQSRDQSLGHVKYESNVACDSRVDDKQSCDHDLGKSACERTESKVVPESHNDDTAVDTCKILQHEKKHFTDLQNHDGPIINHELKHIDPMSELLSSTLHDVSPAFHVETSFVTDDYINMKDNDQVEERKMETIAPVENISHDEAVNKADSIIPIFDAALSHQVVEHVESRDKVCDRNDSVSKEDERAKQQQVVLLQVEAVRAQRRKSPMDEHIGDIMADQDCVQERKNDGVVEDKSNSLVTGNTSKTKKEIRAIREAERVARIMRHRCTRAPRTRGVLFKRLEDGTLVNVDVSNKLAKTREKKHHSKHKDFKSNTSEAKRSVQKEEFNSSPKSMKKDLDPQESNSTEDGGKLDDGINSSDKSKITPRANPSVSAWAAGPPPSMFNRTAGQSKTNKVPPGSPGVVPSPKNSSRMTDVLATNILQTWTSSSVSTNTKVAKGPIISSWSALSEETVTLFPPFSATKQETPHVTADWSMDYALPRDLLSNAAEESDDMSPKALNPVKNSDGVDSSHRKKFSSEKSTRRPLPPKKRKPHTPFPSKPKAENVSNKRNHPNRSQRKVSIEPVQ